MNVNDEPTVLLIDDDPEGRPGIARELRLAGFNVTEADNAANAQRILDINGFDIVVCDMKMESTGSGLDVATFLGPMRATYHSGLDTIFIVYTGNESFVDCVKVIRSGGYDYVSKNEDDSIGHLIRSCRDGLRERREWAVEPDIQFVQQNWQALLDQHGEVWIAVRAGEVIAKSERLSELNDYLKRDYPRSKPYIIHLEREDTAHA